MLVVLVVRASRAYLLIDLGNLELLQPPDAMRRQPAALAPAVGLWPRPGAGRLARGKPTSGVMASAQPIRKQFKWIKTDKSLSVEEVEQDHGRIETRRCFAFNQLDCLVKPERWPDLKSFAVIESERTLNGKIPLEHHFYTSSLHCCMDVARRRVCSVADLAVVYTPALR